MRRESLKDKSGRDLAHQEVRTLAKAQNNHLLSESRFLIPLNATLLADCTVRLSAKSCRR